MPKARTLRCSTLHDACLTLLDEQPRCSAHCRRRSFRIDAFGARAADEVAALLREREGLRDPLNSFSKRRLVRDVFAHNASLARNASTAHLHMIWPEFEKSHGDFVRETIVPLGVHLLAAPLPRHLAFSGVAFPQSIEHLQQLSSVCAFERSSPPYVPRCAARCHARLSVCETTRYGVQSGAAWRAIAALDDVLLGTARDAAAAAVAAPSGSSGQLRVLFAERSRRRFVTNLNAVVAACDGTVVEGATLSCGHRSFVGAPLRAVVSSMRATDVYVAMHGGDVIHGLHMLPGRAPAHPIPAASRFLPHPPRAGRRTHAACSESGTSSSRV